jgi:hypothetical protein
MSMNLQRFEQLIDAYGTDPQRWPVAERSAALKLLADSEQAAELLQQTVWLDKSLDQFAAPAFDQLHDRLLKMPLPAQSKSLLERLVQWLLPLGPGEFAEWWRPATLACLPLVFGLFIGMRLDLFADPSVEFTADDAELMYIALADYSEPQE